MYKVLARPVGQSLPLISSLLKSTPNQASQIPMVPKKNATNNSSVNQPVAMPARANLAIYPTTSADVDVPSHPYGTRRKIRTLAQLYSQTFPVFNNPLYDVEEAPTA